MNNSSKKLIFAAIITLLITAIFLGFSSGIDSPISWLLIAVLVLIPFLYQKTVKCQQLVWQDKYSVGVEILDQDHKKLITLLNRFTTAYDYAISEEFERQSLKDLIEYTKYHFSREEKYLLDTNYQDFDEHKMQHGMMILEVERFVEIYECKGHESLKEVSCFLSNWLLNHIQGCDQAYSSHLNSHGIH